jgi:hypothetical protein
MKLDYKPPGNVAKAFMKDGSFVRGIRGPVGSGKSVTCCMEIMRKAVAQKPNEQGVRRSRWAVIRNTNPQLKTTTIKTWRDWFDDDLGRFVWSPPFTHNICFALGDKTTVELEVIFLALDKTEDVKKLLSLELTGVWVNEAREINKNIVDACTMRVGRFPSMREGGPSWYGVIMDTNAPSEDHWWGIVAGEVPVPEYMTTEERLLMVKPDDWNFFSQPGAMIESKDEHGNLAGYDPNLKSENRANLQEQYYDKIILGKAPSWVKVYVLNQYQALMDGKPVYPTFRRDTHISKDPLIPTDQNDVIVGIDFGRSPSAVFCQQLHTGRWIIFHEIIGKDMGAIRFAEILKREISRHKWDNMTFKFIGDPAGNQMAQVSEHTPFMMLRAAGISAYPAPTNDISIRVEAVESVINRMADGLPCLTVSPTCTSLISGFEGGYQYKRIYYMGTERYEEKPDKNRFSHCHDALQYAFLGGGEGRKVMLGPKTPTSPTTVERVSNPFARLKQRNSRLGRQRAI